ncbi:hypothetical protein AAVH_39733, partial [Aphelenchoides avenae]
MYSSHRQSEEIKTPKKIVINHTQSPQPRAIHSAPIRVAPTRLTISGRPETAAGNALTSVVTEAQRTGVNQGRFEPDYDTILEESEADKS